MQRRTLLKWTGGLFAGGALTQAIPSGTTLWAAESQVSLLRSFFDPQEVMQRLDRQDIAGAIDYAEIGWKKQYEAYYDGKLTLQHYPTAVISQRLQTAFRLTGQRTALIYVVPTPKQLELILLLPGEQPTHHRLSDVERETLFATVKEFREGIVLQSRSRSGYRTAAQQLYRWLIAPLESSLQTANIDTLIFCMGGGLRAVPLAALHDGKQFLVERYSLAVIPAYNLLDDRPVALQNAKVLAMGASEFQEQPPLPAVPLELRAIADNLWAGDWLLNQDFTLANLRDRRQRDLYRIVHLATHASFSPGTSLESYIQFWDQRLSLNLVQSLGLRFPEVQLLVLSACQTAMGDVQAELGFAGLAVMAGSRAALASLWSVSDLGTFLLMTEFYRHLKRLNKSQALRAAQLSMIQGKLNPTQAIAQATRATTLPPEFDSLQNPPDFAHPFFWAAFTIIGNPW